MNKTKEQLIKELRDEKEQAQAMLSKILLPVLITSKKTRKIVYANPYAQKQYEITLDTLMGMEVAEFYTNDEQREKILSNINEDGTVENLEMHWKTYKGNTFYGLLSLTSIIFKGEECFMGMVKDITIQKEQDARLARQSKMEALGEMISNVAHHWRQPLNAITVCSSGLVLQQQLGILDDESLVQELQKIEKEAKFLSNTIDEFRDLIDDANHHEKLNFSLNSTIDAAISINKHSFSIEKNFSRDVDIYGISNRLVKSISAIFQNCEDIFSLKGLENPIVQISTFIRGNIAVIDIVDNGGGIDSSIIDKVFEPYFTTAHKSAGKGLGLYNVLKMISEDMSGNILVKNDSFVYEDDIHTGAKFTIEIPII